MEKLKRIIEYIKTALIAILIISAVCLFIAYMFEFQKTNDNGAIEFEKMMMLSESDPSASYDISNECVFPSAFAYSCDGEKRLFTGSRSLYNTAYSEALSYLSVMYSSGSYCTEITDGAARIWDYCTSRDFVYVRYQSPLPLPVLSFFSGDFSGEIENVVKGSLPYIREIFVMNSDTYLASEFTKVSGISVSPSSGDICAVARDPGGKIYIFFNLSSKKETKFDKALFSAYNKNVWFNNSLFQ